MHEPLLDDDHLRSGSVEIKLEKSYFDVLGICCSSEVSLVENILKSFNGIKDFSVIVPTKTLIVLHDTRLVSQYQIVEALNQARLEANIRTYGRVNEQKKWPNPFIIACALLYFLSFLQYVYHPLRWLALLSVVIGIFPVVKKGFTSIRNFNIDISILVLISVMGTIAMADYTEAATIVSLFIIAEWLESRASHKASSVMQSLTQIVPQTAVMAETGEEIDVGKVKLNSIIAVKAGDYIAIDGIVVDGECEVDEASLTGESFPVVKQLDSHVMAGTININGYISVKTTALAEDCVVSQIAKLVEESQNTKTKTQRLIDKCVQIYTPVVITVSACIALIPAVLRVDNHNHWFRLALVVLVSACPCALVLSTPVAIFCALTKAATSGLLIKGGDYLEILAKINIMAFDKTGTLTRGEFVVRDFQSLCDDISLDSLMYWVSSIEAKSSHPVAAALVGYGRSRFIKPNPEDVEEFHNYPGVGIHGRIDGRDIYIGNRKIVLRAGGETVPPPLQGDSEKGKTMGYIYAGTSLVGIFSVSDTCRSGATEAVKDLKLLGITTVILTGDCNAAVMHVQEQLGNTIELAHAELLPEDKATYIEGFKKEGLTAMIGDGINDAPALAMADIGISMGISGSALATETGNMILMSNDLRVIPQSIQLARKARRTVIENTILSFSIKAVVLVFAIAGHPLVWAAVLADAGTCLLVIFNSMLLLRQTHKPAANSSKVKTKCDGAKISNNDPRCCFEKKTNRNACLTETRASNCQSGLQNCCSKKRIKEELSETDKVCTEPCVSKSQQKSFICNTSDTNQYSETPEIKAKCCDQGKCNIVRVDVRSDVVDDLGCSGSKNINFLTDGSENSLAKKKFDCSKHQIEDLQDFITEQNYATIDIPTDAEQILCMDLQESSPRKRELRTCCKK